MNLYFLQTEIADTIQKTLFEKIKENTATQITALEEDLIVIYIDSEIWSD